MNKIKKRTYQDFVEDMISDGCSLSQIMSVALCCQWEGVQKECYDYAKTLLKSMREKNRKKIKKD